MISAAQENARMLAAMLGLDEEQAATRLEKTILITSDSVSAGWAQEIAELLERTVGVTSDPTVNAQLELVVGAAKPCSALPCLYAAIDSNGASVSKAFKARAGEAPDLFAAIAAAGVAAAALAEVIADTAMPTVSLPLKIDFAQFGVPAAALEREYDLSGSVLVGAGAVAHGFIRALRHLHFSGELAIVDPKKVGSGNPNRCLYLEDTDIGKNKSEALAARAQKDFERLSLTAFVEEYRTYADRLGPSSTAIVTVDSRRARRSIQKELPGRVLDASTTDIQAVIVHSHKQPNAHACLACIYRHIPDELARERSIAEGLGVSLEMVREAFITPEAAALIGAHLPGRDPQQWIGMAYDSLFKQLCGEQALRTPEGKQVLAPFAFVSMLAGALLVCELLRSENDIATTNYWAVNPWGAPISRLRRLRSRISDCEFCSKPGVETVIKELWG
ncbi:molybdopterin/thiamine biosynthesis adenylyltransferase [Agrobacterium tumefaciens]|uniref:ThiF family adenylyltransferase n=1 Tax=Agrobacterium tumefaciens TaxID=358 RepID=UPI000DD0A246|nr:ThiF family adenylyltransferase [Agrobacterium tumefaciens]MBP2510288.1 molybdopterin/thiamine biosynthesis adenylyltransferase [Agrobacterium tumefaciens]MBP2519133.1 molybdopterin/thiamine biosynthesis adenylyltransferase [Agrobacterium tumefaciens]MBP2577141.1 molybdopterin/thiamine biosynthesis adenylyltransferase [Agrobacterium tumefaciens]MBP2596490.1 molybdopterin/thiamine biosynthesis adenylyltransferase [Agrobacterium tumefaciens]MDP9857707.1 molybdopterin/thiamine biosynthesis ade